MTNSIYKFGSELNVVANLKKYSFMYKISHENHYIKNSIMKSYFFVLHKLNKNTFIYFILNKINNIYTYVFIIFLFLLCFSFIKRYKLSVSTSFKNKKIAYSATFSINVKFIGVLISIIYF